MTPVVPVVPLVRWYWRWVVACFAACVTLYALWALGTNTGIHKMVESAYKVTVVVAFTPLLAGLYWPRATTQGGLSGHRPGLSDLVAAGVSGYR